MKKLFVTLFALLAVGAASAQSEIIDKFNKGAEAVKAKDYITAIACFEDVIAKGMDSSEESALTCMETAKKYLPACYLNLGGSAASQKNYDKALEYLTKAADIAELYGNSSAKMKANNIIAKVYQVQGAEAFNNKDYAAAAAVFEKGYAANSRNADMALNLATCYCELGKFEEGMAIYESICAMPTDKYADFIAKANEKKEHYIYNQVAKLQQANDHDGVIAMADKLQAKEPALAERVRINAYYAKRDYAKVIALEETAVAAQTTDEEKSDIYFYVGAAYNAQYKASGYKNEAICNKAIAALKKVTAGKNVAAAKAALAVLTKKE